MADDVAQPAAVDVDALSDEEAHKLLHGEAEASVATEKVEETKPETGDDDDSDISVTVPHKKFHQANERRKAAEERAAQAEQASTLAMQRLSELLNANGEQKQAEPEPDFGPDPDQDPVGALKWAREQVVLRTQQEREQQSKWQQQNQAGKQVQRSLELVGARWAEVEQTIPEINDAWRALDASYRAEMQRLGWRGQALERQMFKVNTDWAQYVVSNSIPIEDFIVGMAEARGWKPGTAEAAKPIEGAERDENGRFKSAEKIDKLEATKQKAKSLGTGGAPVKTGEITPEELVAMPEEDWKEFKKKWDKGGEGGAMRKAFGVA